MTKGPEARVTPPEEAQGTQVEKNVGEINSKIWKEDYLKDNHKRAKERSGQLYGSIKEHAKPEELALVLKTRAWSTYYDDKNEKKLNNTSYTDTPYELAIEGLEKLKEPKEPEHHSIRSGLALVAGLTAAYHLEDKHADAEDLFS
jgi:hypothetical protein